LWVWIWRACACAWGEGGGRGAGGYVCCVGGGRVCACVCVCAGTRVHVCICACPCLWVCLRVGSRERGWGKEQEHLVHTRCYPRPTAHTRACSCQIFPSKREMVEGGERQGGPSFWCGCISQRYHCVKDLLGWFVKDWTWLCTICV